jgi:hypothetical protein
MEGTLVGLKMAGILNWQKFCEVIGNFVYEDFHCHSPLVYLICALLADCAGHVDSISITMAIVIAF